MMINEKSTLVMCLLALLAFNVCGCTEETQQQAEDAVENAEEKASEMSDDVSEKASEISAQVSEAMSNLGEEAMGFLTPIKEKLGSLSELKDKPEELKASVDNILKMIEEKAESIELPESVQGVLDKVKEKLTSLKEYLGGDETDEAEIQKHLDEVKEAASPFSSEE